MSALGEEISKIIVVTNPTVRKHWEQPLLDSFKKTKFASALAVLEMKDGERHKTMASVEELAAGLVKLGADRHSAIVALGGGVVGDTAGLLASLYMRGIAITHVPTTFVAQIDSAIGGKTVEQVLARAALI